MIKDMSNLTLILKIKHSWDHISLSPAFMVTSYVNDKLVHANCLKIRRTFHNEIRSLLDPNNNSNIA